MLQSWLLLSGVGLAAFGLALAAVVGFRGELKLLSLDRPASLVLLQVIGILVLVIALSYLFLGRR